MYTNTRTKNLAGWFMCTDKIPSHFCCFAVGALSCCDVWTFHQDSLVDTKQNLINIEKKLIYMHNTTSTRIPFISIRVVCSQKRYILTSTCVLHNSKWEHSAICQYCFKPTSPTLSLPLQFKGKERGRWAQLVEISQNKLSYTIVLC